MSWLSGYLGNQPSGANSRPSRGQARVNYEEVSDEDLEEGLDFSNHSPLVSPGRPAQSPSVSPRALLIPDPPLTEEVLEEVQAKLADFDTSISLLPHNFSHNTFVVNHINAAYCGL